MKYTFRKIINDIHLWLGLGAGIILFIVCLSGTIYTFRDEIEYSFNPRKYNSASYSREKNPIEIESLISSVEKKERGKVVAVSIPSDKTKNYKLSVIKKEKKTEGRASKRPTNIFVDPYSGIISETGKDKSADFFMFIMKLHRWLLLDSNIGRPVVGIATIIFVILSISGLILWIPKKLKNWKRWAHWKPGLKINLKSNWKRINHDLHNTLGFYSLILLLIMALTGLCWSFEWYRNGVSSLMDSEVFAGRKEKPSSVPPYQKIEIKFKEILTLSDMLLPYEGEVAISLPKDSVSALTIKKNKTGFFALSAFDKIELHPATGEVVKLDKFEDKPWNVQTVSLIKPLHLGDVYGAFSKILYFICCLIGTSLPVTGTIIWLNKMKKKR